MTRAALALLAAGLCSACLSDSSREVLGNVATLQTGTIWKLRNQRGRGPFRVHPVPPDEMLDVVVAAVGRARDVNGAPLAAVFPSVLRGEVVAKERGPGEEGDDSYSSPFRSAVYVVVHPVRGDPSSSRVEFHTMQRGPFHQGVVNWRRDLPRWIEEAVAARGSATR